MRGATHQIGHDLFVSAKNEGRKSNFYDHENPDRGGKRDQSQSSQEVLQNSRLMSSQFLNVIKRSVAVAPFSSWKPWSRLALLILYPRNISLRIVTIMHRK